MSASKVFQRDLDSDLASEVKGHVGRILRSLASCGRSEAKTVDPELAKKEAQQLYDV
jgi:hypothetical protein